MLSLECRNIPAVRESPGGSEILGPDHHGRQLRRVLVVTRDNLRWLKQNLYVCGLAVMSLTDLAGSLDNLLNLKIRVRKFGRAVHILDADAPISANGHLFLHLIDETGHEYLDQQLQQRQQPRDQQEFEALIDHFLTRYHCRRPDEAYIEDAKTGVIVFRMEASKGNLHGRAGGEHMSRRPSALATRPSNGATFGPTCACGGRPAAMRSWSGSTGRTR